MSESLRELVKGALQGMSVEELRQVQKDTRKQLRTKGGQSTSEAKSAAARVNMAKARAARLERIAARKAAQVKAQGTQVAQVAQIAAATAQPPTLVDADLWNLPPVDTQWGTFNHEDLTTLATTDDVQDADADALLGPNLQEAVRYSGGPPKLSHAAVSSLGGKSRSAKKVAASKANMAKARKARHAAAHAGMLTVPEDSNRPTKNLDGA